CGSERLERCAAKPAVGFGERNKENRVGHRQLLAHSEISRAISSTGMSFTIRVSRVCLGSATDWNATAADPAFAALAFCSAGIMVRMFCIPTWGLLAGSGKLPVAQPNRAGGPATTDT